MALPSIMRKLFRNDGYGPLLKPEIIPFASDLASNAADVGASTKWVKDLYGPAPLYAAPDGLPANDGLSSGSPVDIATALEKSAVRVHGRQEIHLAAGTYDDPVLVNSQDVEFILDGTVIFNKGIEVISGVLEIYRSNDSYTFTINNDGTHAIFVHYNSSFYTPISFSINVVGAYTGIRVINCSIAVFTAPVTITTNNINSTGVSVRNNSFVEFSDDLVFSGSAILSFVEVFSCAFFNTYGNITGGSTTVGGTAIYVTGSSVFGFNGSTKKLNVKSSAYNAILIDACSVGDFNGEVTSTNEGNNAGWLSTALAIGGWSYCLVRSKLYLKNTQKTGALLVADSGHFVHTGTVLNFNGREVATGTVVVRNNGVCRKNSSTVISGTVTTGKRYDVHDSGTLVFGVGANGIPGSTAGTVETATYSAYQ